MTFQPGDVFTERQKFPCPFCRAECAVVDPPGVLHVEPVCEGFIKSDPVTIVRLANDAKRREN